MELSVSVTVSSTLGVTVSLPAVTITVTGATFVDLHPTIPTPVYLPKSVILQSTCTKLSLSDCQLITGPTGTTATRSGSTCKVDLKGQIDCNPWCFVKVKGFYGTAKGTVTFKVTSSSENAARVSKSDTETLGDMENNGNIEGCERSNWSMYISTALILLGLASAGALYYKDRSKTKQIAQTQGEVDNAQKTEREEMVTNVPIEQVRKTNWKKLLLEGHCATRLCVYSESVSRWVKLVQLTTVLGAEMGCLGWIYAQDNSQSHYSAGDVLYCVYALLVGLAVHVVLLTLFTVAGKATVKWRRAGIQVVLVCVTALVLGVSVAGTVSLALEQCSESSALWGMSFGLTAAGELLLTQTLVAIARASLSSH